MTCMTQNLPNRSQFLTSADDGRFYRGIARNVAADRLGGKMIQDLGPKDFDDFDDFYVRLRAKGLSPGSIKRYHSVLGGAFQQAMK